MKTNLPLTLVALVALAGCGSGGSADDAASTPPAAPKVTSGNPMGAAPAAQQGQLAPAPPLRTGN